MVSKRLQPTTNIMVDGEKYTVQFYPPTFGLTLYSKLIRLLGAPIVQLFGVFKGKNINLKDLMSNMNVDDFDLDGVSGALQTLFSNLKDEDVAPLIQEILSSTFNASLTCVNETFETEFQGRYNHVFKLVAKTLGAQYPDFLSGILKRQKGAKPASDSNLKAAT